MRIPQRPTESIRYQKDNTGFFDDEFNQFIVVALILVLIILTVKYQPWRILLPAAATASSAATTTVSTAVNSAASTGLSVAEIVKML